MALAFTRPGRSLGDGGYMLAQCAVPLMKTATREPVDSRTPSACYGSMEPFGKTMFVAFLGMLTLPP